MSPADPWDAVVADVAAAFGYTEEGTREYLQHLRPRRCWKQIPRCFNGWGIGLCARPPAHVGDCNPIPNPKEVRA